MKKIISLVLIMILITSCTINARRVKCAEVVVGGGAVVTVGEALVFLLGTLGLTAAADVVYENKESIKQWGLDRAQDFVAYCTDVKNVAEEKVSEVTTWLGNVATGVIDKANNVWNMFMDWTESIYESTYNTDVGSGDALQCASSISLPKTPTWTWCLQEGSEYGNHGSRYTAISGNISYFILSYYNGHYTYCLKVFKSSTADSIVAEGDFNVELASITTAGTYYYCRSMLYDYVPYKVSKYFSSVGDLDSVAEGKTIVPSIEITQEEFDILTNQSNHKEESANIIAGYVDGSQSAIDVDTWERINGVSDIYDRDKSLENVDVVNVGENANINETDVIINWDDLVQEGSVADVITDVHEGTLNPSDALERTNVAVVDLTDGKVIDKDKTIDQIVSDAQLVDYKLGLADIFPFCLPFDLVDFVSCLAADPKAPHFEWPIKYPTNITFTQFDTYTIVIDFKQFESIAQIVRVMETLLFIIGLIMITRAHMIRG